MNENEILKIKNEIITNILNSLKYFKNYDKIFFKSILLKNFNENEIIIIFYYNEFIYKYLEYIKNELNKNLKDYKLIFETNIYKNNKYENDINYYITIKIY